MNRSLKPVHWNNLSITRILCSHEADLPDLFNHKPKQLSSKRAENFE